MNEQRPEATPAPDGPDGPTRGEESLEPAGAGRVGGDRDAEHPPGDGQSTDGQGTDDRTANGRGTDTGAPGAGTLAVLAVAWLLVMLSSLRQAVGADPGDRALTITRAALELPQVISASLVTGVAVGLAAGNLLARFLPSVLTRPVRRLLISGAAGAVTGLAVATPVLLGYEGLPSIAGISTAIAVAALLGGLLSGLRHRVVVAAGTAATLAVFLVGLLEQTFQGDLRVLFGAGPDPESVVAASGWVVLTASLLAGAVAGALSYLYLRRGGPFRLRWPAYLLAGAMPGLLVLAAEAVTRLGGARLFSLVSAASVSDELVLSYFHAARINRALVVLFVGALVAVILLGRTLPPRSEDDLPADPPATPPPDRGPADPPAASLPEREAPGEGRAAQSTS